MNDSTSAPETGSPRQESQSELSAIVAWRRRHISSRMLNWVRKVLPPMSDTERDAIAAGTVWWDGDLFSGKPDWEKLRRFPKTQLTPEEQAFLDGPVQRLCEMVDDWQIRNDGDLSDEVWEFIRRNGFLGIIIPKSYGGLGFSAMAHSDIVIKVSSRSVTAGVTVQVPNSLGPAELLLRYGTDQQRNHYLPRLARGDEIPCFALTAPEAGSDAASIPDHGVVCYADYKGQRTLGMRVTWNKRYITLAPVATILGLAFRLSDPEHLIGDKDDVGITLALIPTDHPGVEIGRRHFPAGQAFQNGPTHGKDVFIPMDWIIGGQKMCGQGWRMLMDCLAAGRAISLPGLATAAIQFSARNTGAYARIRRQFGIPVGKFEGVEEPLARIAGHAYAMEAARKLTAASVDAGEQPAVLSAILKMHATDRMRIAMMDAMDVHGGRAVMDGPRNYLFGTYMSVPIAITVEGANILSRSLIIFGQGAIRAHPHILKEMEAAALANDDEALARFDEEFFAHLRTFTSNTFRAWFHNLTGGMFARTPHVAGVDWIYRRMHASAVTFAAVADMAMGLLGGELKRKESLSARLGDVLSELYILSCVLKRYEDDGLPREDLPLIEWNAREALYRMQTRIDEVLANFPVRWAAWLMRMVAFPLGRHKRPANQRLVHACATLLMQPGAVRDRLTRGIHVTTDPQNATGRIEHAFAAAVERDAIEDKIRAAYKGKRKDRPDVAQMVRDGTLTQTEADALVRANAIVREAIDVDDFEPGEIETVEEPLGEMHRRSATG
jgi:acyl-CoA dehydrogenase